MLSEVWMSCSLSLRLSGGIGRETDLYQFEFLILLSTAFVERHSDAVATFSSSISKRHKLDTSSGISLDSLRYGSTKWNTYSHRGSLSTDIRLFYTIISNWYDCFLTKATEHSSEIIWISSEMVLLGCFKWVHGKCQAYAYLDHTPDWPRPFNWDSARCIALKSYMRTHSLRVSGHIWIRTELGEHFRTTWWMASN